MKSPRRAAWLAFLGIILILLWGLATTYAADAPGPTNRETKGTNGLEIGVPIPKSFLESFGKIFSEGINQGVAGIIGTGLTAALVYMWARAKKLKRRLAGPRFALPPEQTEKLNRVLILGIGGTGKTSLIESLTCNGEIDTRVKTAEVKTYSMVFEVIGSREVKVCRMDFDDYRGQNLGQLVEEYARRHEEGEVFPITTVLFVVDLFYPPNPDETLLVSEKWQKNRVAEHIAAWSEEAISAVLGLTRGRHKLICLFINKTDLLQKIPANREEEVKDAYIKLTRRLADRSAGARLEVLVGSAKEGDRVGKLLRLLIEFAQPVD